MIGLLFTCPRIGGGGLNRTPQWSLYWAQLSLCPTAIRGRQRPRAQFGTAIAVTILNTGTAGEWSDE